MTLNKTTLFCIGIFAIMMLTSCYELTGISIYGPAATDALDGVSTAVQMPRMYEVEGYTQGPRLIERTPWGEIRTGNYTFGMEKCEGCKYTSWNQEISTPNGTYKLNPNGTATRIPWKN